MTRGLLYILQCYILGMLPIFISSTSSNAQPLKKLRASLINSNPSNDFSGYAQVFGINQDIIGILHFTDKYITEIDGNTGRKVPLFSLTIDFTLIKLWHE